MMELPVNKNHHIRSGTTIAGLYSILTSDEYTGIENFRISDIKFGFDKNIYGINKFEYKFKKMEHKIDEEKGVVTFMSHPYDNKKYGYMYVMKPKNISKMQLQMRVDYVQEANDWSNIKIVLSNGISGYSNEYKEAVFDNECSLKLTPKGKLIIHYKDFHKRYTINEYSEYKYMYLKMNIDKKSEMFYSFNGEKWEKLCEVELDNDVFGEVGVYVAPKINPFFYEILPSYLQLCFSTSTKTMLPWTSMDDEIFSNRLSIYHIPSEIINYKNEELIAYYIELLTKKYYIRLRLNEYYLPNTPSFKKIDFPHVNFIYGYDLEKKVFKIIGYNQYLMFTEITFDDFIKSVSYDKHNRDKITLYKYKCGGGNEDFPLSATINNLKAYLNGENKFLTQKDEMIIKDKNLPFVYGNSILELFISSDEYIECFLRDVRIAYKFQERYLMIKEMLTLMNHIEILTDDNCKKHIENIKKLFVLIDGIRECVYKHYNKYDNNIYSKIRDMLTIIMEEDKKATNELILELERINF